MLRLQKKVDRYDVFIIIIICNPLNWNEYYFADLVGKVLWHLTNICNVVKLKMKSKEKKIPCTFKFCEDDFMIKSQAWNISNN